jgi:hypothetical protein
MLASIIVPPAAPIIIGAVLTTVGLAASGFFGHQVFDHQSQVNDRYDRYEQDPNYMCHF